MFTSTVNNNEYKFKFEHKWRKRGKDLKTTCTVSNKDGKVICVEKVHCIPPDSPNKYMGKMKSLQRVVEDIFPADRVSRATIWNDFQIAFQKPMTLKNQLKNLRKFLSEKYPDVLNEYQEYRR